MLTGSGHKIPLIREIWRQIIPVYAPLNVLSVYFTLTRFMYVPYNRYYYVLFCSDEKAMMYNV